MKPHPDIASLINRFQLKKIHAAHSGRELMSSLAQLVSDSNDEFATDLSDEVHSVVEYLLANMHAYAPPVNVLHKFLVQVKRANHQSKTVTKVKSSIQASKREYSACAQNAQAKIVSNAYELIPN